MHLSDGGSGLLMADIATYLLNTWLFIKVLIGFSVIIFVHELGHFLAAKWVGVRVDRFAVGFGYRLFGYRGGEGFTFGHKPNYTADDLKDKSYGETDYCFKALPIGGYVKMLGQDDVVIDEKTGEVHMSDDPRAFTSRPVGQRMLVVSAGVVFNMVFAAILFMAAFLWGVPMETPAIGSVGPDSPAAKAGLKPGDRVVAVDGKHLLSFMDFVLAQAFADGPLELTIERDGKLLDDPIEVTPEEGLMNGLSGIGAGQPMTTEFIADGDPVSGHEIPLAGDRVLKVNGTPVETATGVITGFVLSAGELVTLTVERPPSDGVGEPRILDTVQYPRLALDRPRGDAGEQNILGFVPLHAVGGVIPGKPAEKAGFEVGDSIVQWGPIPNPTYTEIIETIHNSDDQPIDVLIERNGERVHLSVTPAVPFKLFGKTKPEVGLAFDRFVPNDPPLVAQVLSGTPAALLGLPRGSLILAVEGKSTPRWSDVIARLLSAAGRTITIRYRTGSDEASGTMRVPGSVVNGLDLGPAAQIIEIAGKKQTRLENDQTAALPSLAAIRALLAEHIGEEVAVRYVQDPREAKSQTGRFLVQPDNTDPWQMGVVYIYAPRFATLTYTVDAGGDPFRAMWMGMETTWSKLREVYLMMSFMAKRKVGVEHVSGPIGIFNVAMQRAEAGLPELMFFLAFISVNLAVINFLPLPVVDGGLMVFLLIEKIKGKPLSLKTQMVSTIVGLAVIVLTFLFVTFQDVSRLLGG